MDNERLYECPISLKRFKNPRVLPCGHTFDLQSLQKAGNVISSCPLCRTEVNIYDPRYLPVNWILISILGLSVPTDKCTSKYKTQVHKECYRMREHIHFANQRGRKTFRYNPRRVFQSYRDNIDRDLINEEVMTYLKCSGFHVSYEKRKFCFFTRKEVTVSWN